VDQEQGKPPHLQQGSKRIVIPFHSGKMLHPKIVKQLQQAISGQA
jgi:predicted RNA binding protein YcfA (HicA-like mRNA interferase family)